MKDNIMRNNKIETHKITWFGLDLCPQDKAQMATFCYSFFEWCLQYNRLLTVKFDYYESFFVSSKIGKI
jgi:hypothetical protein